MTLARGQASWKTLARSKAPVAGLDGPVARCRYSSHGAGHGRGDRRRLSSAGAASALCGGGQISPVTVASGNWNGVTWKLQAIDSGDGRYGGDRVRRRHVARRLV
jgi:hypothetical protein